MKFLFGFPQTDKIVGYGCFRIGDRHLNAVALRIQIFFGQVRVKGRQRGRTDQFAETEPVALGQKAGMRHSLADKIPEADVVHQITISRSERRGR